MALHRPWEADPERLRGELQRQVPGRMPERGGVHEPRRGTQRHRAMAAGLQPGASTLVPRLSHPRLTPSSVPLLPASQPRPPPPVSRYPLPSSSSLNSPPVRHPLFFLHFFLFLFFFFFFLFFLSFFFF